MEPRKTQWKTSLYISLVVMVVFAAVLFFMSRPRWRVADSGTLEIPAGHVYVDDFETGSPQRIRVTLSERDDVPVVAFWVSDVDHAWIQSDRPPRDDLVERIRRQTFLRTMTGTRTSEALVDSGQHYLYFEQDPSDPELRPLHLDYRIETRQ